MDPHRSNPSTRPTDPPADNAVLGAMIRDVADDWQMPPQRLDDVTWRERVAGPGALRGARGAGGLRWTRRFVAATALAMVATVAVSAGAIWLTTPRGNVGIASPSPSVSPSASGSTEPTPRPKLVDLRRDPDRHVDPGERHRDVASRGSRPRATCHGRCSRSKVSAVSLSRAQVADGSASASGTSSQRATLP